MGLGQAVEGRWWSHLSVPGNHLLLVLPNRTPLMRPHRPPPPCLDPVYPLQFFLPLMIGWFSLNVPSGLSLYYLSNTALSAAQQIYLKKLGGANVVMNELGPVTKPGSGRRAGEQRAGVARLQRGRRCR